MSTSVKEKPISLKDDGENDDGQTFYNLVHGKNRYDLNSKIMLTAIISLSAVVLLVLALHLYARYILRRQASRRRAAIHHLGLTMAHARSAEDQPPNTGLDPSVVASLPVFAFKSDYNHIECSVCLSALDDGEIAKLLPNCKHTFHVECIDKWLSSKSTCPICRTEVAPRWLQPEPREGPVESSSAPASAPPLEGLSSVQTSSCMINNNGSSGNNSSRLSSFRRILSRERSSRRIQPCGEQDQDVIDDLERQ